MPGPYVNDPVPVAPVPDLLNAHPCMFWGCTKRSVPEKLEEEELLEDVLPDPLETDDPDPDDTDEPLPLETELPVPEETELELLLASLHPVARSATSVGRRTLP